MLFWAIFISLILHFGAFISSYLIPENWLPQQASRTELIELDVASVPEEPAEQQFVPKIETPELDEDPEKLKEKARFLSDKLRRFREELQAAQLGETRNRQPLPSNLKPLWKPNLRDAQQAQADRDRSKQKDFDGLAPSVLDTRVRARPAPQFSTIGETLPEDIRKGMFNVLNTDYLTFYSFYERFGTLVRFSWAKQLEKVATNGSVRQIMNNSSNRQWTTELKVWMKPDGEVIRVAVMKPSGIPMLDKAHLQTFYDVGLVPNPPVEMIKEGQIMVDVGLTIFYNP